MTRPCGGFFLPIALTMDRNKKVVSVMPLELFEKWGRNVWF